MSETRFFWVKCWALEILGIARAAMARTTESFAYFERHDMDCIPSRRSFQSARQLERDKLLGWLWPACIGPGITAQGDAADDGKVVRGDEGNVTKTSNRSQHLAGTGYWFCWGCKVLVILDRVSAPQVRTGW